MNLRDLPDMSDALKQVQAIEEKKKLDAVDHKELEGSHADRKDKDLDNDNDVDSSDEYLHNRRKAVKKAIAQKEEVELDENRRAARAAGGYKDDSKKQPDPSKDGFTGVGNMSIDQIRKMSARIEKEKTKKEEFDIVGWAEDAILELSEEEAIDSLTDEELSLIHI